MANIKCPNCGKVFAVDEKDYSDILMQIKNEEFNKELETRLKLVQEQNKTSESLLREQLNNQHEQELNAIKAKITELENEKQRLEEAHNHDLENLKNQLELEKKDANSELENKNKELELELQNKEKELNKQKEDSQKELENQLAILEARKEKEKTELEASLNAKLQKAENDLTLEKNNAQHSIKDAVKEKEREIERLNAEIQINEQKFEMEKSNMENRHKDELKLKDDEVAFYRDLKAKTSVKLLGESLEQHCQVAFNQIRMVSYPHAEFGKDNDVVEGTKGDFVFRDWTEDGAELISIMFEMKNESDVSATKHKNEDFFKKLDEDRKKKNCEYAVLVSLLEPDNEYYNMGIVDVSYAYPKMFVIRPQFFVPFIGLLYNAALTNANEKNELLKIKNQNIDISNFEDKLYDFQEKFGKNYQSAKTNFAKAIEEIDKTITHLNKVKDNLMTADNQLRLANDKAQDLTIRKLTHNNPTMKALFDQARKEKPIENINTEEDEPEIYDDEPDLEETNTSSGATSPEIDEIEEKTKDVATNIIIRRLKECRLSLLKEGYYTIDKLLTNDMIEQIAEKHPSNVDELKEIIGENIEYYVCHKILEAIRYKDNQ